MIQECFLLLFNDVTDGWRAANHVNLFSLASSTLLSNHRIFLLSLKSRNMKNVTKLSERELASSSKVSWHDQYRDSAWIFVGGLPYDLSEGDIICVFSQYGEIVNINLIRDKKTGKQKGFCFICYEDQRSTVLAVDNLNGIKVNIYCDNSSAKCVNHNWVFLLV